MSGYFQYPSTLAPTWVTPAAVSYAYWNGFHTQAGTWSRTNTALGDPAVNSGTPVLSELTNLNFGTVTCYNNGALMPGITATPTVAGRYAVDVDIVLTGDTAAAQVTAALFDVTQASYVDSKSFRAAGANYNVPMHLSAIIQFTGGAKSLTVRLAASSGKATIDQESSANSFIVTWKLYYIGP